MTNVFRIVLAQLNPIMGDVHGNLTRARQARAEAAAAKADLILFPELFIVGYPPEDLVLKPALQTDAMEAVEKLAKETADGGPAVLIGAPWVEHDKLYNACLYLDGGKIAGKTFKVDLPNYGVFDEKRVFAPGPMPGPFNIRGVRVGVPICQDIWTPEITTHLAAMGAEILLSPNGSPFEVGKQHVRLNLIAARVTEAKLPLIYLNQIGGQDELVFDGASVVANADRSIAWALPAWEEKLVVTEWTKTLGTWVCTPGERAPSDELSQSIYHAMMLGLRDYVNKNRFPGVVLGMSGGIDSALSAAVAVDALGADRVRCVMLPSKYTSQDSLDDAAECSKALGVSYDTVAIEAVVEAFGNALAPTFSNKRVDTTEENIQSRARGVILMAISNKFGPMVLTTGNKSEMSVGYATLYGDMCGGYNVLKDVYKMEVFRLCRWRNEHKPRGALGPEGRVIPERIITKPPSAELRENQKDEDSLPPYEILDGILECLVENEMTFEDTCAKGYHPATVKRIEQLLYVSEYKRRQAPPGVKISARNFGRDRRYPITNAFRSEEFKPVRGSRLDKLRHE
ncbi:MAG: NAD+ synthase [Alphaproteobacteria bacterium]|nr:NAD+ synthase [Reyranella sp.]MBL6854592.1 NAD+ synthase [Alphaproteobacteria bacterium]MBL6940119.1 NAD+ synthase [Alphaproteobacteria bacterium]MBL7100206.1 NAD+ synthase [Alphaproteobacteria bacterium]